MISVVIPTYNRGSLIRRSIYSILNQTYEDIEVVVVDDNSNDNTEDIINKMTDRRVKYFKLNENKGACFARNKGVELSKGEYIAFQDSDDKWNKLKLEKQLDYLLDKGLDVVSCKIRIIREKDENIFPKYNNLDNDDIYINNKISTQTILGKKECFLDIKFDEKLPRFQDWDLAINLVKKYKVEILNEVLVDAYIQENSISKNPQKAVKAMEIFLNKHGINDKVCGNYLRLIGVYKLQQNEESRKYFINAFKKYPNNKKIIIDLLLTLLNLKKIHYNIYFKNGRFK
jgi:glycosyltransferase involved in cell wall biosynthesis